MTVWQLLAAAGCLVGGAYQGLAILAAWRFWRRRDPEPSTFPKVAILKPVRGADYAFQEAVESHTRIDYPNYEVMFGFSDPEDPAKRVVQEFPALRRIDVESFTPNRKVGTLMALLPHTDAEIIVVSDADIRVTPDYLRRIVAPLEDPSIGLVTCLYRARFDSLASRVEALAVATEFATGALMAPFFGFGEFGLGSTLCLRRRDLERMGGFAALAEYLADDYQMGKQIVRLGLKNHLSRLVVETALSGGWRDVWRHQVRWARTIRLSRFDGYAGVPVMQAGVWAAFALAAGLWPLAIAVLVLRLMMAAFAGGVVLGARHVLRDLWLVPLRDLAGFAVWIAGLIGTTVEWRGTRLGLEPDGRIRQLP